MPVPDMQTRFRDFQGCEFCGAFSFNKNDYIGRRYKQ